MSYGPPPGGYPQYPPQGGYQQPPPGQYPQYPPQQGYPSQQGYGGHSPAPQGYPPPQQGYPPQGYPPQQQAPYGAPSQSPYPPQQGYPPRQQPAYGAPPAGHYPHQQQYGAPRPPHQEYGSPAPQHQQYGPPPPTPPQPGGYGQPSPHQQPYGGPPAAPYGAPPPQPYGAPPSQPTPPSPGYIPNQAAHVDMSAAADNCRRAMKGFGTNEALLIQTLCHLTPLEIPALKAAYHHQHHRDLARDVESEVSGYFETCLLSILRGPLMQDVHSLGKALHGAGTDEVLLNDVLIGRSNADMKAIKAAYQHHYHRSLEDDVRGDLSMKTERMFMMILAATRQEDSAPVIPQNVDADVVEIHRATEARAGADQLTVCSILTNRSDGHIRAIALAYEARYRIPLEQMLKREFQGHMEMALVQIVRCGADRIMRDAIALEDAMAGLGTNDNWLVVRVVRMHWDRAHMHQVKNAYQQRYRRDLASRIKGETSGYYEKALLAMIE